MKSAGHTFSMHFLFCLMALMLGHVSWGQQKGDVKFIVDNENGYFEILVDDTLLIKRYRDSLEVGMHKAKIWSYGYDVSEIEFTVAADTVTEIYVKLNRSTAYAAYEESYSRYRMKFHKSITLPVSLSLAFTVSSATFMLNAYDLKKKVLIDMDLYSQTTFPDEIALIKSRVEENNRKYTINRTCYYITGGIAIAGIATSIYSGIQFKKNNTEPTYSKESPFSDKVGLQFTGTGIALQFKIG